jgi:hypothetical protein
MMRKSRACAPHAGAIVAGIVARIPSTVVDQAGFILNTISLFSLEQLAHQRKEQP